MEALNSTMPDHMWIRRRDERSSKIKAEVTEVIGSLW